MAIETYNETRYACKFTSVETDESGNQVTETKLKALKESDANAKLEAAQKAGKPEPFEVVKMATFIYHEARSLADMAELVPDEAECVNIWNRGYVLKQQGEVIDHTVDLEDTVGVSAAFDLQAESAIKSERRKASPAEKALKALSALTPEQIAAVLAQFSAVNAA